MDYSLIREVLVSNFIQLITLGGSIHPYLGGLVALLGVVGIAWLGIKMGKQKWKETKKKAGEVVADVGGDQDHAKKVQDGVDSFLDGD